MDAVITRAFSIDVVETVDGEAKTTGRIKYEAGETVTVDEATWIHWSGLGLVRKSEKSTKKPFDDAPTA